MNLRSLFPNPKKSQPQIDQLNIETLEERMMLSTVSMTFVGQEGGEQLDVYANDELVRTFILSEFSQTGTITLDETVTANDIRIEFVNDRWDPAAGIDLNATIEFLSVDGVEVDVNGPDMYSTGTWTQADGIVGGFGRGNTLHTNGFLEFRGDITPPATELVFAGKQWSINGSAINATVSGGVLQLTGVDGEVSVSAEYDVSGGTEYNFQVDAYRGTRSFDRIGQPYAAVGVNFYSFNGDYLGQEVIGVNGNHTDPATSQLRTFDTPQGATSAYVWVWTGVGPSNPIIVNDISFEVAQPNVVNGTTSADYLRGTPGADIINGNGSGFGAGAVDRYELSAGNDTLNGFNFSNDRIVAPGTASDYVITRYVSNGNQRLDSYVISSASTGTDTAINMNSIQFSDGIVRSFEDLVVNPSGVFTGTSGSDNIRGTNSDETLIGNGGSDRFVLSAGNDRIIGNEGRTDQIDAFGSPAGYSFVRNGEGTVTVSYQGGVAVLTSIENVWFSGNLVAIDSLISNRQAG
ncbi:MAG: hypothetical protein AB8B55_00610 [Mariniblastus sp.]